MAILKKTAKAEQAASIREEVLKSYREHRAHVGTLVEQAPAAVKEEKPASKTTRKASAKKAPAAKKTDAPKVSLTLQYLGKELTQEAMVEAVKAQWTGADIKTLALYVKPEDNAVYYVVNGESTGKIEL